LMSQVKVVELPPKVSELRRPSRVVGEGGREAAYGRRYEAVGGVVGVVVAVLGEPVADGVVGVGVGLGPGGR